MEEEQSRSSDLEGMEQGNKEKIDAPSHFPGTDKLVTSEETKEVKEKSEETKEPTDWFEPLEDDDDDANSLEFSASDRRAFRSRDPEEESLAGESERSGSVAGSEKAFRKLGRTRRKRTGPEEGWDDCPSLGEGWKRKETVRQSGTRSGQSDVYYMSPQGERARSRIELSIMLNRDLTSFEFKNGIFKNQNSGPLTLKRRIRKKVREYSSSESSFVERGEGTDTPDSHHRLTPNTPITLITPITPSFKPVASNQTSSTNSTTESPVKSSPPKDDNIKLPGPTSSKPLFFPSINGEFGTEESILVCSRCSLAFTGTRYDKKRKKPLCPSCWGMRTNPHPLIRFRKWIPCGQCVGCRNKVNCGLCRPCKEERTTESRKRCRKRKCLCPIRKGPEGFTMPRLDDSFDDAQEVADLQHLSPKGSDTENFSATLDLDLDDEDMSTDEDDDWHKRRKRRSCGECQACLYKKDCGTCDFCIDKPKFGGSNKKRQKCRLRQCHRQAMSHLLPPPWEGSEGVAISNRSRPQHTYSRKRKRASPLSEDEDDDTNQRVVNRRIENTSSTKAQQNVRTSMQLNNSVFGQQNGVTGRNHQNSNHTSSDLKPRSKWHVTSNAQTHDEKEELEEEEDYPTITQIYSLADDPSDVNTEHQLTKLLTSLRSSVLPILWYAIMVEGPQLQLVQCSKQSSMTDTIVQIDPSFLFKVTVQKHPLLPTHPLYDSHPPHLRSITEVVDLLLDLDKYSVCHGLPPTESVVSRSPIILERAPTCEFLIRKSDTICTNCRMLCE